MWCKTKMSQTYYKENWRLKQEDATGTDQAEINICYLKAVGINYE